jgi:hypothetical protein
MSKEPTDRIKRAILVVDTNIVYPDSVLIYRAIFGHGLSSPVRLIAEVRRPTVMARRELASAKHPYDWLIPGVTGCWRA